ncbi:GGDEF domain-containing protein [Carboxydocella sp. JDF658]|uniref:GGDEF domain-containing protein n=1 Tax=Carboxydocella sp. JDF658 TaxID=1926600 RepID=UPI0009AD2EAD|nr:GGDEF domain-containing protein [Carboxydocella sp. JDF658]
MQEVLLNVIKSSINEILAGLYDAVRLVCCASHDQYILTADGELKKQEISCHEFWQRPHPCQNCVGQRSKHSCGQEEKVEIYEDKIFLVVAMPLAGGEYVLEIIKDISHLIGARNEIIQRCEQLREQLEVLARQAYVDSLTGLWNRRYLEEKFPETLKKAGLMGKQVAVLMVDIDHFKQINDTYGHNFGDRVLERVGQILQQGIRGRDAAVRYGGEEFVVILYDVPAEVAVRIAERMRNQIAAEEFQFCDRQVRVTVSIGLAFSRADKSAEDLLASADRRLYLAKQQGRNRVIWTEA